MVWHSESVETSEIELPYLPKFASSPFFGLNPEICSPHQQENDDVLFHGDFTDNVSEEIFDKFWPNTHPEYATKGFFGIALQKNSSWKAWYSYKRGLWGRGNFYCNGSVCNWESNDTDRDWKTPYFWIKETHISVPWTVAAPGEGTGGPGSPFIFRPNWGPKGTETNFLETAWPPSPPPPAYLKVWTRQCLDDGNQSEKADECSENVNIPSVLFLSPSYKDNTKEDLFRVVNTCWERI